MKKNKLLIRISAIILMFVMVSAVNATPHFASKYDKKCSYCHTAWPQLNSKGRIFRERGYRFKEDLTGKSSSITESGSFPISALVVARPYDKKKNGERKMRALQEVELFLGGAINKNISTFFEIEAEDETDFKAEFANMALSYRVSDAINFHAAYAPSIWADSYGLLGDQFRLTRSHVGIIDQSYGGANSGASLRARRQNFEFSGRVNKFFYSAGISGEANDYQGVQAEGITGRLAYDITKNMMVGVFTESGDTKQKTGVSNTRDYIRNGIDFQMDIGSSRIQAAYVAAEDDNATATSKDKNNAYTVQYYYTMKTMTGSPTFVPIARLDQYEKTNGNDDYTELTLNLTYYINENFKAFVEYWDQIDVPSAETANNRTTVQFAVGF